MKHCRSIAFLTVLVSWFAAAVPVQAEFQAVMESKPSAGGNQEVLLLSQALSRVFEHNPELSVSALEIQAASARILQAGLKPNPEFTSTVENFLAIGGPGIFRSTESTLQLSQRLELGNKRVLRVRAGEMEKVVAGKGLELKKSQLIEESAMAFAEILAGQERLANQQELSQLARQAHAIVVERVAAGKVSPVEQTRATVTLASTQLEEEKHLRALIAAKDRLAALWGGTFQDIGIVQGRFEIPRISSDLMMPCIEKAPDIRLADAMVDFRRSLLDLEKAAAKPDLTVSAGFKRLNLEDQNAWVAGASIPLPLHDKRQGAIAEARILIDKSLSEKKAVQWRMRAAFHQARNEHELALLETKSLLQTALPAAKEALAAMEEGYRYGKFDYLNVLDAQRTYAELQRRYIEAVAAGLKAAITLERLARCDAPVDPSSLSGGMKETTYEK
jgi:cobalt-zinc-cadmium efflux system outer membrane protein